MLQALGVRSVRLLTNNPAKIAGLERCGVRVASREPLVAPPTDHNRFYLETKARRSGHMIDLAEERLPEQSDPVVVEGMRRT